MNLGNNILKARKKLQLSQEKLGEQIGVTRQTISNWELNETVPDTRQLIALSKVLAISIDALVENEIQNVIEQKVNAVENEVVKNSNLLKIIIAVMAIIIVIMSLAFISAT